MNALLAASIQSFRCCRATCSWKIKRRIPGREAALQCDRFDYSDRPKVALYELMDIFNARHILPASPNITIERPHNPLIRRFLFRFVIKPCVVAGESMLTTAYGAFTGKTWEALADFCSVCIRRCRHRPRNERCGLKLDWLRGCLQTPRMMEPPSRCRNSLAQQVVPDHRR